MNETVARWLYFAAQRWRGEPVLAVLRDLEASQHWSGERLRTLQWDRQRALVRHAYETVPHYRELWQAQGFTPDDLRSHEDWALLPLLDKPTLQDSGTRLHSSRAPKGLKSATSGSSGMPVAVLRSHQSWAHHHANYFRHWRWHGVRAGERYAYFWGLALDEQGRREARLKDWIFNRSRCSPFEMSGERARAFYQMLLRRPAHFALGYASAVTQFADELDAQGLDGRALGWKVAVTTSEVLHPHRQERIQSVFGCPVTENYGAAEVGVAGIRCEHGGMHVPCESVVVDRVPGPGDLFEIVVTDLHNYTQPIIRYRIGDLVEESPASCGCGRSLPLLGTIHGRAGDMITLPGGRRVSGLLPYYIFRPHARSGKVREYQFVQFPDDRIELRIVPGTGWTDDLTRQVEDEVTRGLGVPVQLRLVERFERRGRGKHRDFVRAEDAEA